MKVIDLLNKIANGEEVPKKIKFDDNIYKLQSPKCYMCEESDKVFEEDFIFEDLNKEVEVIEEDKKIEHFYFSVFQDEKLGGRQVVENLEKKLNEIIDKINKGE